MFGIRQTTPDKISSRIKKLSEELSPFEKPVFVEVKPIYRSQTCFLNCDKYIQEHPGAEIVYGWVFWESTMICEAEFHAAIREDGHLFCVTTHVDGEKQLMFLPDLKRKPSFAPAIVSGQKTAIVHTYSNAIRGVQPATPYWVAVPPDSVRNHFDLFRSGKSVLIQHKGALPDGAIRTQW